MIQAAELVARLGLVPHPEGGHFREVHRSAQTVRRDGQERAALTTIYFLLGALDAPGSTPVAVAPAHWWQAARPLGAFTLVGCTVGPGFSYDDFRFVAEVPGHEEAFAGELARYAAML